jgi:RND superfamily putative drug exporter
LILAVLGAIASTQLSGHLTTSLAVPGTSSQDAADLLTTEFGDDPEGSFTVVIPAAARTAKQLHSWRAGLVAAARVVPGAAVTPPVDAPGFVYAGIDSPLSLQAATRETQVLRGAIARMGVRHSELTGAPALQYDVAPVLSSDLRRGELVALVVAFVVLLGLLGPTMAALIPFVFAFCTVSVVLGLLDVISTHVLLVRYIPNLVELIGFGLAVDYSLLVVRRFREQLDEGMAVPEAVEVTMATAGRAVVASGLIVAGGLLTLLAIPIPFMRSLGFAGLLVPVASVVAATTLLPASLALLGRHVEPRHLRRLSIVHSGGRVWRRVAIMATSYPVQTLCGSLIVLGAAAAPLVWLQLTPVSVMAIPSTSASALGMRLIIDRLGPGALEPIDIVIDTHRAGGARAAPITTATLRLARQLVSDPSVLAVAIGNRPPYVDKTARYEQVIVVPRDDLGAPATRQLVMSLRGRTLRAARFSRGVAIDVGGGPAQGVDFLARLYTVFPWLVAVIAGLSFILLVRYFRSLLLGAMAILLDACSIAAAYGLLVVVFRFGVGAKTLGLYRLSQVEGWVPVFCFAVLFGLSMDYEVFIVSRMRELRDRGASTVQAIRDGLSLTGRVVSSAAVIMVGALSGLVLGQIGGLQELGVSLILGVVIDTTIVRGLLLPSLMTLCGDACWWLPASIARLLRVEAPPSAAGGRGLER